MEMSRGKDRGGVKGGVEVKRGRVVKLAGIQLADIKYYFWGCFYGHDINKDIFFR